MAYNFKNLADVELLSAMPENASVIVEVDGATKRAPQVDEIALIVNSESLEEVPEGAEVLSVVNGEIKRVPGSGLGGGEDAWDFIIIDDNSSFRYSLMDLSVDGFYFAKGDSQTLLEMVGAGVVPRICFKAAGGGDAEFTTIVPVRVDYNYGSGIFSAYFMFVDFYSDPIFARVELRDYYGEAYAWDCVVYGGMPQ